MRKLIKAAAILTVMASAMCGHFITADALEGETEAPGRVSVTSLTAKNDAVYVKWNEVPGAENYQVTYSTSPDFTENLHNSYPSRPTDICLANVPKAGETWYVKVRAYASADGGRVYGEYSKTWSADVKGNVKKVTIPYLNYTFKDGKITPKVTVRDTLGNKLVKDTDYTVSYKNNLNVGTAAITVKGKGNYQGIVVKNFNIKPNSLSDNKVTIPSLTYTWLGEDVTPEPKVWMNGKKLVRGTDYTVSYKNNSAPGTAEVTVYGKGNYSGSKTRTFTVEKRSGGTKKVSGKVYTFSSKGLPMYYTENDVRRYTDVWLTQNLKPAINRCGAETDSSKPKVTFTSASKGVSSRKLTLKWSHKYDNEYDSYIIFKSDAEGSAWMRLADISSDKPPKDSSYSYTDDNSFNTYRFVRYAIVGKRSGSCSVPSFTEAWSKVNICIDPGHYIGGNSNGIYSEGTQMLILGNKLKQALESFEAGGAAFAGTKITRIGDGRTERFASGVGDERNYTYNSQGWVNALASRGTYAKGCDFFISLHSNAMSNWNEGHLWSVNPYPNHTALSSVSDSLLVYELGQAASDTIAPGGISITSRCGFGRNNISDWSDGSVTHFKVNRGADSIGVPGVLLEHSFHTNPAVRNWLGVESNLAKLGMAEAKAFLTHYGFPIA